MTAGKLSKLVRAILLMLTTAYSLPVGAQSFEWKRATPESQGFSAAKLEAMLDTLKDHATHSLLVIRNDKIVLEWYAKDWSAERIHGTASLAKALVGGMSLVTALTDGRLKPDDYVWKYVPEWKNDPLKSKITIRQLATHTSGLEDAELMVRDANGVEGEMPHMKLPGWKGQFWRQDPDPFTVSRDSTSVIFQPGTGYQYSNPGMAMLSYAITASYRGTSYANVRQLLWERVYKTIGIKQGAWQVGYGKTFHIGGLDLVPNWGGAAYTARATARIGRLMLRKGNWEGRQILDSTWVKKVTTQSGTPLPPRNNKQPAPASTMGWYVNFDGVWPRVPRDAYCGAGAHNQHLIVIPSLDLIIVRYGRDMFDPAKGEGFFYGVEKYLLNMLIDAMAEPHQANGIARPR
jgi:CubicO group peptidase (beta-lactamase class C family)